MEEKELEYRLFILGESYYENEHKDLDKESLFPIEWSISTNYKLKNKILEEAIMNNKKITEIPLYQELIEGENILYK